MACNHDDKRCEVCASCQQCYPHAVGYRDESGIRGECRDAHLRETLEEFEVWERGAASIIARARETGNAGNERAARELLDDLARIRDGILGTGDL